jgi:hypothetical protein
MSKGSISKKKNPTPEKGIRKNEKEEEFKHKISVSKPTECYHVIFVRHNLRADIVMIFLIFNFQCPIVLL